MKSSDLLAQMVALGITTAEASRRQSAFSLAAWLAANGDQTEEGTLKRKTQRWLSDSEDGAAPWLLHVALGLAIKAAHAPRPL